MCCTVQINEHNSSVHCLAARQIITTTAAYYFQRLRSRFAGTDCTAAGDERGTPPAPVRSARRSTSRSQNGVDSHDFPCRITSPGRHFRPCTRFTFVTSGGRRGCSIADADPSHRQHRRGTSPQMIEDIAVEREVCKR